MSLRRIFSLFLLCFPFTSQAATYTVDRSDDSAAATTCSDSTSNDCSLRGAIIKANLDATADTVIVPSGTYSVTIPNGNVEGFGNAATDATRGDLDIIKPITISGAGADVTTVQVTGTGDDRVFHVPAGFAGLVTLSGLTITGGLGQRGTGIQVFNDDSLTVDSCHIVGNNSSSSGGGIAFESTGVLTITNSTVSGNSADDRGGGLFFESGSGVIINSTFFDNTNTGGGTSDSGGGGITIATAPGGVKIISSTIVGNTEDTVGSTGGGLRVTAAVTIKNSIISGNDVAGVSQNCTISGGGSLTSQGYNISSDATCGLTSTGDQQSISGSIVASVLAENGAVVDTLILASSSPAIDLVPAASCVDASGAALTEDQRGFSRPLTATGATTACDAGAVEVGCGNQVVEASESCDEAGASTATCDSNCTAVACGDGTLNTVAGEECEDSNTTAGDGCSATCTTEAGTSTVCGNSIIQGSEACDDGNTTSGDGCSSTCTTETEELSTDNPTVDFFTLTIGEAVSLVAPAPVGAAADLETLGLFVAASEDTCNCEWSATPTSIGTFSDSATCATDLTPAAAGDGTLTVTVDCGDSGSDTFTQSLTVAGAASSGGGCSLRADSDGEASRGAFLAFLGSVVGGLWLRRRAQWAR